jgi:hypothetical protein
MKLYKSILAGLICASAFVTSAQAALMNVNTTYTPPTTTSITTTSPFDFLLNINSVYHAGVDVLKSGTITFALSDPNGGNEQLEITFSFTSSNTNGIQQFTINGNNNVNNGGTASPIVTLNAASVGDLAADGILAVRLGAANGDYNFVNARFDGVIDANGAVPEPMSLALMGLGLAGIAAMRTRKSA